MVFAAHTQFLQSGFLGVDLFFVLSGFLITSMLLSEFAATGTIDVKRFYTRRALRLLPALFLMVCCVIAITALYRPSELLMTLKNAGAIVLYFWNWVLVSNYGYDGWQYQWVFGHMWSLSVEEQFYILWPFVLLLASSASRPKLVVSALLFAGIAAPAVARPFSYDPDRIFNLYFRTDLHFDGLMWGALGAWVIARNWLAEHERGRQILRIAGGVGLAAFVCAGAFELFHSGIAFLGAWTVLDGLAMVAIVSSVSNPAKPVRLILEARPLTWTGKISYGLYLWHLPIFFYCRSLPVNPTLQSLCAIVITFGIASLSYYGMERHILRLKARFAVKTGKNHAPVATTAL